MRAEVGSFLWGSAPRLARARLAHPFGDPQADGRSAAQLAATVVALQRGVQLQQAGQRGVQFGQRPGPCLIGELLGDGTG